MIAEVKIKRIDDSDSTLQISKLDRSGRVTGLKTIGHKIGCNHKTILVELNEHESIRVMSVKR
jgi:hypothetical protein